MSHPVHHLGAMVNAFVDGELDHDRRDEVLTHLAACGACRAEVDAVRRFKRALRSTDAPAPPFDLSSRLLAVSASGIPTGFPTAPVGAAPHPRRRPLEVHPRLRRTALSGAVVALGIGGALQLAGPAPRPQVVPVDPTNAGFVEDHVRISYQEVPLTEPNAVPASSSQLNVETTAKQRRLTP